MSGQEKTQEELKRFYYDLMLAENYSIDKIQEMKKKAKHIQPDLTSYYY